MTDDSKPHQPLFLQPGTPEQPEPESAARADSWTEPHDYSSIFSSPA